MLGRLLKYEFKAMGRVMLPLYGAWLAISVLLGFVIRFDSGRNSSMVGIFSAILGILYVVAIVAIVIVTLVMIVDRYSKNLLGREGYLMFTLPVTTGEHIWNKTISAALWTLFSYVVGVLSFILIGLCSGSGVVNMHDAYGDFLGIMNYVQDNVGFGRAALGILEILLLVLLVAGVFALKIYASISIGHQSNNHKGLCSVGVFIGLSILESIVLGFLNFANFAYTPKLSTNTLADAVSSASVAMLLIGLVLAAVGAVYFIISYLLTDRKLNLE